jgi:glycosyltransferase 2 family protein
VNKSSVENNENNHLTIIILIALILLFTLSIIFIYFIAKGRFDKYVIFKKASDFLKSFWIGFSSIKNVKNKFAFVFHSIFMWIMYFLLIYVVFPAFEGFSDLSLLSAMTIFVAASLGMLAPAPNGTGAYHFMVSQTLVLLGIGIEQALVFALVVHGMQTIVLMLGGIISLIAIPLVNNNKLK